MVRDGEVCADAKATGHLRMFSRPVPKADECDRWRVCSRVTTIVTAGWTRPRRPRERHWTTIDGERLVRDVVRVDVAQVLKTTVVTATSETPKH